MTTKKREAAGPPTPPAISKRFRFPLLQVIGMPLLALVPILALFGVFGETREAVEAANQQLEMRVEYSSRLRYKMMGTLTVEIVNISGQALSSAEVRFDREYMDAFSAVEFTPSIRRITEAFFIVEVENLQPRETRVISVSIKGEEYGRHDGTISAAAEGGQPLQVAVETLTFP